MQTRFTNTRAMALVIASACFLIANSSPVLSFQEPGSITRILRWSDVSRSGDIKIPICSTSLSLFDPQRLDVSIVSLPSTTTLPRGSISRVRMIYDNGYQLVIRLASRVPPNRQDDELRVIIRLPESQQDPEVTRLQQTICSAPAVVTEVIAHEKTATERRMLFSPALSFPTGGGAQFAANADLYRGNPLKLRNPINLIELNLAMDKASEAQADPNYANLGVSFKKVIPFHWRRLNRAVRNYRAADSAMRAMTASNADVAGRAEFASTQRRIESAVDDTAELKKSFFRDMEIKAFGPHLEMNFDGIRPGPVIKFVNSSEFQLRTAAKPFISKNLFWSLQLMPIGLDAGVTVRNRDNKAEQGHGLFRLTTGGNGKIKFRFPCRDDLLADRIELEIKAINRYLFNEESAFNPITRLNDSLVKGSKYAAQVDVRYVFGFRVPIPRRIFGFNLPDITRKPAIVVSYKNGYFPPVYEFNNGVHVRFTLATGDEDTSSDIRMSERDLLRP